MGTVIPPHGGLPLSTNFIGNMTWAQKPAATAMRGALAFITDIGVAGSYWFSDGTTWRPFGSCKMQTRTTQDTSSGSSEYILEQQLFPAGFLQNGMIVRVQFSQTKSATTAATTTRLRINSSADLTGSPGTVISQARPAIGDTALISVVEFVRVSATAVRCMTAAINAPYSSSATASYGTNITVPDMDANPAYLSLTTQNASSEVSTNQLFEVSVR